MAAAVAVVLPETIPVTAPVAGVADAISFAGDVYDAANRDYSGITFDVIAKVVEGTNFEKYVPVIGFGAHLSGFINAFHADQTQMPVQIPIPNPIITTP